jgi:hypothetical protein
MRLLELRLFGCDPKGERVFGLSGAMLVASCTRMPCGAVVEGIRRGVVCGFEL